MTISWVLGTLVLWTLATCAFCSESVFEEFTNFSFFACLLVAYACLSGLGFFAGAFTLLWLVLRVCRYVNGAPFKVGDYVTVLTGPHAGTVARVDEIIVGQGGGLLPRLELGPDAAAQHSDIFEDYAILRQSQSTDLNPNV